MAQSDLTRVVEPACRKLADQQQVELVDVELAREGASRYLRIYIDKPDGITLSDCETYHRAVMPLVERVDYDFLEVCSPGIDRPLKKQKDYDAHVGDLVEVHLYRAVDKCRRFEGELLGLVEGQVKIMAGETEMSFALKDISLCKPVVIITEEDLAEGEELIDGDEEGEASR
ncbi:MAG: ribosome maturation factor RimP [Clostridia bacterium]|nr:ribosome maturation factor RimP [Clostridia bacterium]MBQ6857860.1 ribosome maturation factor RimP [Clostridia bacterium]MBQ7051407.1 ribosome maturation factor RimP [Clostridia bacterium]